MQRYFAKEKTSDGLTLYDSDLHHIKNVMRNKINDQIEVVYENIVYLCNIDSLSPITLSIASESTEDKEMATELTIAVALVNEQKMDLILQKLTELGVSRIIPIKTERSIIKLDDKKESKKIQRWQTICKEACEQSKRTKLPKVENIMSLNELTKIDTSLKLICSLNDKTKPLKDYLNRTIESIIFAIGPEGGFTEKEETFLISNGFLPVSLGKRVMRVETATIYVASIINYICEGWYYEVYCWFL